MVATDDANTLPTAESPTATSIAAKASEPRMQSQELRHETKAEAEAGAK